jgi:hypothetical protein
VNVRAGPILAAQDELLQHIIRRVEKQPADACEISRLPRPVLAFANFASQSGNGAPQPPNRFCEGRELLDREQPAACRKLPKLALKRVQFRELGHVDSARSEDKSFSRGEPLQALQPLKGPRQIARKEIIRGGRRRVRLLYKPHEIQRRQADP